MELIEARRRKLWFLALDIDFVYIHSSHRHSGDGFINNYRFIISSIKTKLLLLHIKFYHWTWLTADMSYSLQQFNVPSLFKFKKPNTTIPFSRKVKADLKSPKETFLLFPNIRECVFHTIIFFPYCFSFRCLPRLLVNVVIIFF